LGLRCVERGSKLSQELEVQHIFASLTIPSFPFIVISLPRFTPMVNRVEVDAVAHVRQRGDGTHEIHEVSEHLQGVAERAACFAAKFGSGEWGRVAGLWHDLGSTTPSSSDISPA
jgi:hypothetical protein